MTPTAELRFVERWDTDEVTHDTRVIRILQQKWERSKATAASLDIEQYQWRDVPCVKEEA